MQPRPLRVFARRSALTAAVLSLLLSGACSDGTVRIAFQPAKGSVYDYVIDVDSETQTFLEGQSPSRSENEFTIGAKHLVQRTGADGSEVDVTLTTAGGSSRQLLVRLDRAAQLTEVIEVEGLPADVLGELGLSEIFPAAVAAPPKGGLEPGATWKINDPVQVTGSPRERLVGSGRLAELDVRDGRRVAVVIATYRLPVSRRTEGENSVREFEGAQVTRSTTTYDLADGSVLAAEAVTTGKFKVSLTPPGDGEGPALRGRLEVVVRSRTERVDS